MTKINLCRRRFAAIFVFFAIIFVSPQALALEDPAIAAAAAILVDPSTGMVLYEKNADEKRYPASTTKIMTAMIVLEHAELTDMVTAIEEDFATIEPGSSNANLQVGETSSVHDLLYCLMLPSANEAATMLARHVAGSLDAFVDMMNAKAQALGCTSTHFANPNGLHNDNHYTTARDLMTIAAAAMQNETFAEIVNTAQKSLQPTNVHTNGQKIFTTNLLTLRRTDANFYRYCKGIKTGFTSAAGYCLVGTATKNDATLISVVLGCEGTSGATSQSFPETKRLFEWGFNNFSQRTLVEEDVATADIPVRLSTQTDHIVLLTGSELSAVVPNDLALEDLVIKQNLPEDLAAPITQGQKIGSLDVSYGDFHYGTVDLVAMNDVALSQVLYYADKLENFFKSDLFKYIVLALAGVLGVFIFFRGIHVARKRRHRQKQMRNRYRNYK